MSKRSLRKQLYLMPLLICILAFSCQVWYPSNLIVPYPKLGFIDLTEIVAPFLVLIPTSFLLYNNYEIELALTCGVSTPRLLFTKYTAVLLYTLLPLYAMVLLYQYLPFTPDKQDKIIHPIVIPENYKVYMLISVTVTVLFFSSLILFFRVLMRNCFTPVAIGIIVHASFDHFNRLLRSGLTDVRSALFDPFLSNYFLGDEMPNLYELDGMHNQWTNNRLLFFGISIILLTLTYLLLRREKLHESFGE